MTFSAKQYFERMGSGSGAGRLRADDPMDAGYVWTLIDNAQHLIDESPKYRINFLGSAADAQVLFGPKVTIYFWTDVLSFDSYPRYDVRVAFLKGTVAGTVTARASIVTYSVETVSDPGEFGVLGTFTGTTPASGAAWTIDGRVGNVDVARCPQYFYPAAKFPGQDAIIGQRALLKVLIEWDNQFDGVSGHNASVVGVQVREYLT